ncbi:MAG: hypothetical protein EAZ65_07765 [Verrucomicrobia bacterium]|nr:MAG: hypothetical protein EAZ84_07030 [Verrucomicrobiota bacterium]TAE87053.1 MAG: hypothetical protein EAZ82_09115 [Verrucomicrobiota bacterium]TAF24840.1 MAG: hypothetical protein EAZ71_09350 [Verrucomicrobiota bacterium]TAF40602.1 MAG: hypothetical protein EAZ65_07765 [Verrucomicrobiota bacterium]
MKTLVKSTVLKSALISTLLGTAASMAGEAEATTTTESGSKFAGTLNLDLNSHFISYGFDVWGDGNDVEDGTFNPSLELTWALPADFTAILGTWWDVNDKVPSAIGGKLQEVDVWAGLGYKVGDLSITGLYQNWIYGSANEQIVDVKFAYDCLLAPSLTIHNRVDPGASGGQNGTVLVAGVSHSVEAGPVTFSFPVNIAYFLEDDFHPASTDSGLGYGSLGATATYALGFLGEEYGSWNLHGGLTYYVTDSDVVANSDAGRPDNDFLTANIGIGCAF